MIKTNGIGAVAAGLFCLIAGSAGTSWAEAGFGAGQSLEVKEFMAQARVSVAPESPGQARIFAFAGPSSDSPQKPEQVDLCGRLSINEVVHERFTRTVVQIGGIGVGTLDEAVRKEFPALAGSVVCAAGPVAQGKLMVETIAVRQAWETSLCGRLSIKEVVHERFTRTVVQIGGISVGSLDARVHEQFQRYGGALVCAFGAANNGKLIVSSLRGKSGDSDPAPKF